MHPDDTGASDVKSQPQSLMEAQALHTLVTHLEEKLRAVLRPSNIEKNQASTEQVKSELMQELGYLQGRLKSILERLHV